MIVVLFIVSQLLAMGCVSAYGLHLEREEERSRRSSVIPEHEHS